MYNSSRWMVLASQEDSVGLGSDCNCACPSVRSSPYLAPLPPSTFVHCHADQHYMMLDAEHSVAFVPSRSQVVVLNSDALELLERLRIPQQLMQLPEDERIVVEQFYRLGLIQCVGDTSTMLLPADELVAWLHVTNACNLRCTYCYINKSNEAMSAETGFTAIDAILRSAHLHNYQRIMLKYAGGEASLNLSLVEELHTYAQKRAAAHGIVLQGVVLSNGVGLTHHKLQRIQDLQLRLMISLDGLHTFHDAQRPTIHGQQSFAATVAGIERARERGLDITISVTVTGANVEGLPAVVTWLLDRELHFSINFYRECDPGTRFAELQLDEQHLIHNLQAAYRVIEQRPPRYSLLGCLLDRTNLGVAHNQTCAVGQNYLVIDHGGSIAKCQMEIEHPITNIWEYDPLTVIRLDQTGVQNLPVEQKEGCRTCEWKYWCAGGCAVATFRATGRYDIQSPNCRIYKTLYPEVIRLEAARLLFWASRS